MLALVDEYQAEKKFFTDDEDIEAKAKLLYAPVYQEMSDIKMLSESKELSFTYTGQDGYDEVKLPSCKKVKQIIVVDKNNIPTTGDYYYISDQTIMISKKLNVKYLCEYIPKVTQITEETPNDFELELTDDANKFLAFKVAGDLLKTDQSVDYKAFEQRVREMFGNFDTTTREIAVTIGEGEL
jgi:hypothetical protein